MYMSDLLWNTVHFYTHPMHHLYLTDAIEKVLRRYTKRL